jgi:hypothetical protein
MPSHDSYLDARGKGSQGEGSGAASLRDQVGYLREQLRREQDAHAEARRIIAALTSRILEIEAPSEPRGAPENRGPSYSPTEAREQPGRVEPQPSVEGAQEPAQPRSWWRMMFGG